ALAAEPKNAEFRRFLGYHLRNLADTLVGLKDHAAVASAVHELLSAAAKEDPARYAGVEILARCSSLARTDPQLPEGERGKRADQYADQAMAALVQAVAGGFRDVKRLSAAEVLAPLRPRADFKKLVADLSAQQALTAARYQISQGNNALNLGQPKEAD